MMNDILPTKMNYTVIRSRIRNYAKRHGVDNEDLVDICVDQIRKWKADGQIFDDGDVELALTRVYAKIRAASPDGKKVKKTPGTKHESLCWHCHNACPIRLNNRYISGCSWSLHNLPVEGWTAKKGIVSYEVQECPKFIPG